MVSWDSPGVSASAVHGRSYYLCNFTWAQNGRKFSTVAWWISRKLFRFLLDLRNLKNSKHLSLDSDPRFFLSTRMLLELFFLRLSEGTPACKKEPIPKDVTFQLGSSKRKRWGASGRLFFQFRALLCHVFLIDPNAL